MFKAVLNRYYILQCSNYRANFCLRPTEHVASIKSSNIILLVNFHIFHVWVIFYYSGACLPIELPADDSYFRSTCMTFVRTAPATCDGCKPCMFFFPFSDLSVFKDFSTMDL